MPSGRWMWFIDGENLTMQGQALAQQHNLSLQKCLHYSPNEFIWFPTTDIKQHIFDVNYVNYENLPVIIQEHPVRSYYYTSIVGDDHKISKTKEALW